MNGAPGIVFGTAGHIDHGKTALIRALTGIDTDRLAEEKRRGISIDLGFAHLDLPDGRRVGLIDVPGHERFVKNMLAGAAGIEAVLLVVSAAESVKPQTREHFEICRLLGISRGIIVLTKSDLVDAEQIRAAEAAVRSVCADSFLASAPAVTVSAVTGDGISELKREIAVLVDSMARQDGRARSGLPRLPVDRAFAMKGFGTVVTGTLWSGSLRKGDNVRIQPLQRDVRIRDIQVHGKAVTTAIAGHRVAVNLTGIEAAELRRGHVLTVPSAVETTTMIDARIEAVRDQEISAINGQFVLHIGTAETIARLKILRTDPKQSALARLYLSDPVLAAPGDRFVLRRASPALTVGGGVVIDATPPKRLNRSKTVARLEGLESASPVGRIELLVEESVHGRTISDLVRMTGLLEFEVRDLLGQSTNLVVALAAQRVVSKRWLDASRRKLVEWLRTFHAKNPGLTGAPIAAARLGLEANLAAIVFDGFADVRVSRDIVSLATHTARVSSEESQGLKKMEEAFRRAGLEPRPAAEVVRTISSNPTQGRRMLESLIKNKTLVRVAEDLVFHAEAIGRLRTLLAAQRGRKFSVPEFKNWTRVSRKYAIPLLEYLDRERITRREGDARVVL